MQVFTSAQLASALLSATAQTSITLHDGIYPMDGAPLSLKGTIKAAPGARPIITAADGSAPRVNVADGATVAGIWFGGTKQIDDRPVVIGSDTTIKGCTFFNYYGGIVEGAGVRNTIQGCRFVECGTENLWHAIYVSNGDPSHWTVIEDCCFIGGMGYGTQLWHAPSNTTIRRNFYGDNEWMLVVNGSGHLAEDNIFWSNRGGALGMLGVYLAAGAYIVRKNLFGAGTLPTYIETVDATMDDNTFYTGAPGPFGTNQHIVSSVAGVDGAAVTGAIASLRLAFAQSVAALHGDTTIETNFATCAAAVAVWGG